MKEKFKEFPISSWAIDNRITIFMLTLVIIVAGMVSFQVLPKENFPEIQWPVIFVSTPYPGTSAEDIENLITRPLEKEISSISELKKPWDTVTGLPMSSGRIAMRTSGLSCYLN